MQSVTKIRLYVSPSDERKLLSTVERYNDACNYVSPIAFSEKQFSSIGLQNLTYYDVRKTFGLSAQMAQLAIRKVASSYRSTKDAIKKQNRIYRALNEPTEVLEELSFKKHGGICYDSRVLSIGRNMVSILTLEGRLKLRYKKPEYFPAPKSVKQTDLLYRGGKFWLHVTVGLPDVEPFVPEEYIGVDLGIVNITTTSDGVVYNSEATEKVRKRYGSLRARLQERGSKDAKEKLRKVSGKERRFKNNANHCISKEVVRLAQDTKRGIALEDLTGILMRTTVRHEQRERHHKWAFHELRSFIEYKAEKLGVLLKIVDGSYTSQQCSVCGYIDSRNRKSQAEFHCLKCGYTENADINAARNIAARALVNEPIAVCPSKEGRLNRKPIKSTVSAMEPCPRLFH